METNLSDAARGGTYETLKQVLCTPFVFVRVSFSIQKLCVHIFQNRILKRFHKRNRRHMEMLQFL